MMMRFTSISMLLSVSMTYNLQVLYLLTWNYVVSFLSLSGTEGEEEVFQGNGQPCTGGNSYF